MVNKLLENCVIENKVQYVVAKAVSKEIPVLKKLLTLEDLVLFESAEYHINNAYDEHFAYLCEKELKAEIEIEAGEKAVDRLYEAKEAALGRVMLQLIIGRY
jgi:hypothetical protein